MLSIDNIKKAAQQIQDELLLIRRYLHAHPELSFEEAHTATYLAALLTKWDISYEQGVGGHGIVGMIHGNKPSKKVVALRADMDALPIVEQNSCDYKSTNSGVMHACGHDVHMTCLLGAVKILNDHKQSFEGSIKFIFQPAEEKVPGGALKMIEAGVLENPKPDLIIGEHVYPDLEVGKVGFRSGKYMASNDEINLCIRGKGGHAAIPGQFDDTVLAASQIVVALQQLVSRRATASIPTVLSFGKFIAEGAYNVIPDEVKVYGTFRTFDESWRKKAHQMITDIAQHTAKAYGTECEVFIDHGYPYLVNDVKHTELAKRAAIEYLGRKNVIDLDVRMTAEDFARFSHLVPACFYRLGTANKRKGIKHKLHTPRFDVDERSIEIGSGLMAWIALGELHAS